MTCSRLIRTDLPEVHIDFNRYRSLHREGMHLISGWFQRAWDKRDCQGDNCFEAFIFAWFAINGWAACVTEQDDDTKYIDALTRDQTLCKEFSRLRARPDTPFASSATQFAAFWPIFEVRYFRQRGVRIYLPEYDRGKTIKYYMGHIAEGKTPFAPQCWKMHENAGEKPPVDWPHTLSALYRVRCNLFHGEKAAHSEMDQQVVTSAFRTLVYFFREAQLL